ncbi:MAG: GAF domain-containing protein [Candidatus Rokubacteria bacterium]|nr:GAF domain-containing protein [Candidatus Rokubacteria bacterium]
MRWSDAVIDALHDAVLVTDRALVVLAWNRAMHAMTGRAPSSALGRSIRDTVRLFEDVAVLEAIDRALEGVEARIDALDGAVLGDDMVDRRPAWVEICCSPWRDEGGSVGGVAVRITDITERRRQAEFTGALAAIGRSLTSALDLDAVLDAVADRARVIMDADAALVVGWDGAAPSFTIMRAVGRLSREYVAAGTIMAGRGPIYQAFTEARPVATRNILGDPGYWLPSDRRRQIQSEGYKAVAAAPLAAKGRVHGALVAHYWTEREVSPDELAALLRLAEQGALAIETARLYADARRRATRLGELVAVTQSVSASLDTGDVLQRIADAAAGLSAGGIAVVNVHDPEQNLLRHVAVSGGEVLGLPMELPAAAGLPGLVFAERRPRLIEAPANHPRTFARDWWRARPGSSYYGVPIVAGDGVLGVLGCIVGGRTPSLEEQETLQLLAAHAGIALRNAARYEAERLQAERVRALADVNRQISAALDLDDLLRTIAESAAKLTGVRFATFWVADERTQTLTFSRGSDAGMAADFAARPVTFGHGAVGWTARHRTPLVLDDAIADGRVLDTAWWRRWGLCSCAAYPVLAGDELLAVLVLSHSQPIRVAGEARGMMELFIAQAAVAIQNARLYQEASRRQAMAEAVARLGRELTATLDVARIAEVVTRGAVDLLRPRSAAVYRYDADGSLHALDAYGVDGPMMKGAVLAPGEGVAGRAVLERRPCTTRDVLTDPAIARSPGFVALIGSTGLRAAAAVPLLAHGHVVGALGVGGETGREFTPDELQALQAFADQAALALENAGLYASAREHVTRLRETQAQLVQAAKMSAIGQLVSGVAHELNNPLSVVIGYGQLLLGRDIPAGLRRPIELMVSQGDRMAKIVRSLLFFARQRPPEHGAVDLNRVIEETLAFRQSQLALSGILVTKELAPELPSITGDAQQLQQVFLNLVLNAEQAIGETRCGGQIILRTSTSRDAGVVRAEVVDDGPGIPPDAVGRVFEPFFTTKAVGNGSGLGLAVSYGIVQEHGGRLTVESRAGRTAFAVELPLCGPESVPAAVVLNPPLRVDGRSALVVEDEPTVLELVVELLELTGWRVDVASGGRSGLARVREHRYDLVVSDIRMADGGGEDFYRQATAGDATLARRFIFVTGDTANPGVWRFLTQAGVPVIEKPFKAAVFLDAVRRVVSALTSSVSTA